MDPGGAEKSADEGVGRAAGDAEVPGEDVPSDGADEGGKDGELVGIGGVDEAGGDCLGNAADLGGADEIEDGCHDDGREGSQDAGGDDGGDDVGGIVKTVGVVEKQAEEND